MNSSVALAMEATFVDRVFKNQVVSPVILFKLKN